MILHQKRSGHTLLWEVPDHAVVDAEHCDAVMVPNAEFAAELQQVSDEATTKLIPGVMYLSTEDAEDFAAKRLWKRFWTERFEEAK